MNPMLQALNRNAQPRQQTSMNNTFQMIQRFAEFKKQMQGKDPQAIIDELLKSGRMTPEQFEMLKQEAHSLQNILK